MGSSTFHPSRNSIRLPQYSTRMYHIRKSAAATFHPDVSYPELWPSDVPPSPDVSHPTDISGWEKRAFQLLRIYISGSSNSAHPESFTANFAQCRGVLLKFPDMCDRHFEIFCFRYLLSKSPNSPCNPPII